MASVSGAISKLDKTMSRFESVESADEFASCMLEFLKSHIPWDADGTNLLPLVGGKELSDEEIEALSEEDLDKYFESQDDAATLVCNVLEYFFSNTLDIIEE